MNGKGCTFSGVPPGGWFGEGSVIKRELRKWKELPIEKDRKADLKFTTRTYRAFRRWQACECFDAVFLASVVRTSHDQLSDTSGINGDGTTTAAKILASAATSTGRVSS
ncbi:hypothetical protein VSR69_41000 [Paraburkholderia phytofirmans]